jgi:hypothetical protein
LIIFSGGAKVCRMSEKTLTARQLAERYNVAPSTARAWFLNGIVPRAYLKKNELGSFWVVPENALAGFQPPQPGRPPKAKPGQSNGKKRGKK